MKKKLLFYAIWSKENCEYLDDGFNEIAKRSIELLVRWYCMKVLGNPSYNHYIKTLPLAELCTEYDLEIHESEIMFEA